MLPATPVRTEHLLRSMICNALATRILEKAGFFSYEDQKRPSQNCWTRRTLKRVLVDKGRFEGSASPLRSRQAKFDGQYDGHASNSKWWFETYHDHMSKLVLASWCQLLAVTKKSLV